MVRTPTLLGMAGMLLLLFQACPSSAPEAEPIPTRKEEATAASPTQTPTQEPATPSPTSTSQPVVTPTPEPSGATVVVDPSCCQFDSPGDDSRNKAEEYVCFTNNGSEPAQMQDWVLKDEYGWTYRFPTFTLDTGASVRVRSGCGQDTATDLYWCDEGASAIWNNDGDTVFLRDAGGNLVTQYSY